MTETINLYSALRGFELASNETKQAVPTGNYPRNYSKTTEAEFNNILWDTNFDTITWEDAVKYYKYATLHSLTDSHSEEDDLRESEIDRHRKISKKVVEEAPIDIHTGEGIGHMSGLAYLVEHSNMAGEGMPVVELRKLSGGTESVFTKKRLREVLNKASRSENIVESSHNIVMGRKASFDSIWQDHSLDYSVREQAAREAGSINFNYRRLLKEEIDRFDQNAVPTKLIDLKEVLIERLEAIALARIRYLRGVSTQQGIDLPATCQDAADAERSIALFRYKGALQINAADTIDNINRQFELYRSNINNVVVGNSPYFTLENEQGELSSTYSATSRNGVLILTARQNEALPKDVLQVSGTGHNGSFAIAKTASHQINFRLTADDGKSAVFDIVARNLCGPTKIKVNLN